VKKDKDKKKKTYGLVEILKIIADALFSILDVPLLLIGMTLISFGAYLIYRPAGYIIAGCCFMAMAFFIAKKQAQGR
jgi:hypothetical protein